MKKILITGANSYIGTSFENHLKSFDSYIIETIDMLDSSWRNKSFSGYDAVFHVAGIAHSDTGNADEETKANYYRVNTDLTIEVAKKAKADNVRQFVFMSSIIVYGTKNEYISADTIPCPDNFYGDSKLKADIGISALADDSFKVASVRPPMIYGKGSKGNYPKLSKLVQLLPVFPDFDNQRSMLYIENLCEFLRLVIENEDSGIFYPQNNEYVKTTDLAKAISAAHKKPLLTTRLGNPFIRILKNHPLMKKLFGNMCYDKALSQYKDNYCTVSFEESIKRTEV